MFNIFRRNTFREPEETRLYVNNKEAEGLKPKKTFKKNFLVFLGLAFISIYIFSVKDVNAKAEAEDNIFKPGEVADAAIIQGNNQEQLQQEAKKEKQAYEGTLWPGFHPRVLKWESKIPNWIEEVGATGIIDPNAAATLIQIKSCGHKHATSGSNAMGLFQVMPFHFPDLDKKPKDFPYRPAVNSYYGLSYFKKCLAKADGDYYLAFAFYNGGVNLDPNNPDNWHAETKRYAMWGSGIMKDINKGLEESPTLNKWLRNAPNMCSDGFQSNLRTDIFGD